MRQHLHNYQNCRYHEMTASGLARHKTFSCGLNILYSNIGRNTRQQSEQLRFFEYYSLAHLYRGSGIFLIPGGKPIELHAGDAILIAPGFLHYYGPCHDKAGFEEDNICFFGELPDFLFANGYLQSRIFSQGTTRILEPVHSRLNSGDLLEQLHGMLDFQALLLGLAAEHGSPQQIERRSPIERLLYGIWQNPSHWWTVEEMAQFCQLDRERFRNAFRAHTGSLPKAYVDNFKIDLARHWLETFDWTIEHISRNLGYTDKFHFSRRFKNLTGLAPDHFRRKVREKLAATPPESE